MRPVVLYIAMSLDGFIADVKHGVDWIQGHDPEVMSEGTYGDFIQTVDTVIMGWNTYEQIVTTLSPDKWVYPDQQTYVMTHRALEPQPSICFTNQDPSVLLEQLRQQTGKSIWICGGAHLAQQLIASDQIDQYRITIIPRLLGKGIRLFGLMDKSILLRHQSSQSDNGMVELVYERFRDF